MHYVLILLLFLSVSRRKTFEKENLQLEYIGNKFTEKFAFNLW